MKYLKTFEMFDSENLRDEHIHDTNSGTQSPNAGYGFFVSMTPPNDLFPRSNL